MERPLRIAPSILAADFADLATAIKDAEDGGADCIHVDVMDGHFVPNITVGPPVVRAMRRVTKLPLDVHLMINDPGKWVPAFADAGADLLVVHVEATVHLHRVLQQIRAAGLRPGVSLNPATPPTAISEVLDDVQFVLIMSVNPGFGGQVFVEKSVQRIAQVRDMLDRAGSEAELAVDGGINPDTAARVAAAGATMLISGSAIFHCQAGVATAISGLRKAAHRGRRDRLREEKR